MNNRQTLQKEIEQAPDLPLLPPGISHLLKALTNDSISYQQLAVELESFPTIAVKIVATANSAWASPISPITTLRDACSRIGLPLVRSISIALSVSQVFVPSRCPLFDPKTFWISALLTAEAANICAEKNPEICPDTARLTGLLHNMGLLWLADKKPLETSEAIKTSQNKDSQSLSQILSDKYDLDLYSVGGCLITSMKLPDIMASAIASYSINSADSSQALTKNHLYARHLASAVLSHTESESSQEDDIRNNIFYKRLAEKLPGIQSLAQTLFFS